MEKIGFLAGTKDSSFFLSFPALLFLKLRESGRPEEPGGETVLRVIQTFDIASH